MIVVVILQAIIIAQMEGRGNQIMITPREKYINKHIQLPEHHPPSCPPLSSDQVDGHCSQF